jgi:hypothetical protein
MPGEKAMQMPPETSNQLNGIRAFFYIHGVICFTCGPGNGECHPAGLYEEKDYTGEYTFFSYMPGVKTVERFLHWWHVASRVSR